MTSNAPTIDMTHVGAARVLISRLSLGTAKLNARENQEEATRVIGAALDSGIGYFDTSAFYEVGQSEMALGAALAELGNPEVTISTKVGRVVDPEARVWHFDFSRDGVLRSLESSLKRLRRDRVEIVYVHDPDNHATEATESALPTLIELREQGVISAIGVGMNQWQLPLQFIREFDLDVILLAGRYSLLDSTGADEFLPECIERGVGIVNGGVFNSGILANPSDQATFAYRPASEELLVTARRMQAITEKYGIALTNVAQAYSAAHPAVSSVLVGVSRSSQLVRNVDAWHREIPLELWTELDEAGLIPQGGIFPQ